VYHLFVVRHPRRQELFDHLAAEGVACGIHYPNPLPRAEPFRDAVTYPFDLPVCSRLCAEILSLPIYPEMTREQVARVGRAIRTFACREVTVA
ncbi:MAG: DegT/DnrJ/EryC1/StrS family aminotransferase, partial [Pirellulaceae bacterium]